VEKLNFNNLFDNILLKKSDNPVDDLLNRLPVACGCLDAQGALLAMNNMWLSLFDIKNCAEFEMILSTHQPCGTSSRVFLSKQIQKALEAGLCNFKLAINKSCGNSNFLDITMQRENPNMVFVCAHEIKEEISEKSKKEVIINESLTGKEHEPHELMKLIIDSAPSVVNLWEKEREAHELMSIVVDSAPFVINLWSHDCKLIQTSQQAVKLYNVSSKEEYIERFFDLSPKRQPCGALSNDMAPYYLNKAYQEGYVQFEWLHCTLDGKPIPTEITLVRFERAGKYMLVGYTTDLSLAKAAMQREREANELNEIFLNASPLIMNIWDENFGLISTSEQSVKMFGLKNKEQYIERFFELSPEFQPCGTRSSEKALSYIQQAFDEGSVIFEWVHQTLEGEIVPTEITLERFRYQNKNRIVAYTVDLRPVKVAMQAEQDRELNERTKLFFNASPLGVSIFDENRNFVDCNMSKVKMFGFNNKEELAKELRKPFPVLSPEFQPCGTRSKDKAQMLFGKLISNHYAQFEWMHHDANGKELPTETTIVIVPYKNTFEIVTYVRDLREIKAAMEKERIAEVAVESSQAKSRFLARMSHEIRTPITAVLGIAEIQLHNANLSPQLVEAFAKIHNSSNILLGIINDILDLSKIEADKMSIINEEYNTASLISDISHLHFSYTDSKDIMFQLNVDENLPATFIGDALRIKQVVNNLLSNAFKYTESGSVTLSSSQRNSRHFSVAGLGDGNCENNFPANKRATPSLSKGSAVGGYYYGNSGGFGAESPLDTPAPYTTLVITVKDTGYGMTQKQINDLYSDYTRFHEKEKRFIGGTGLGMPIVYSLIKMMNAHIDIKSELGKGTCIIVDLPQKLVSYEILGKEVVNSLRCFEVSALSSAKRFNFEPEPMPYGSVLIVDDVEANVYVIQGLLAFYELNIESCINGYEAINKIKQGKVYDIIFMDHMMPGLNGIETMNILREKGYTQPIVALTANAIIGQAEEFIKQGFDGFISKPIQTVHLNSILVKHIKEKQPKEVIEAALLAKRKAPSQGIKIEDFQKDAELLAKLRLDYVKNHRNMISEIQEAIKTGNLPVAHRLAHTLKGLGGLMHEPKLTELASKVEYLLKDEKLPINELLSKLEQEHRRVIETIATPESDIFANTHVLDKEKAKIVFDKLAPLLETHNADSLLLLDDLRAIPETAVLVKLIDDFEFETSIKLLKTLREILEI